MSDEPTSQPTPALRPVGILRALLRAPGLHAMGRLGFPAWQADGLVLLGAPRGRGELRLEPYAHPT